MARNARKRTLGKLQLIALVYQLSEITRKAQICNKIAILKFNPPPLENCVQILRNHRLRAACFWEKKRHFCHCSCWDHGHDRIWLRFREIHKFNYFFREIHNTWLYLFERLENSFYLLYFIWSFCFADFGHIEIVLEPVTCVPKTHAISSKIRQTC